MARRSVALVVLAIVTLSVVAGALSGAVAAQSDDRVSNESRPTAADLTITELRQGGQKPENAPDSVRTSGTYTEYAVKTLPTHLLTIEGEDSPMWSFLSPGETVRRNYVQLHSRRGFGLDEKNVTVRIAYWSTKTVTVEEDDGDVREETVAANVTTHSTTATLTSGYSDPVRIDLHPHYNDKTRVTMCVEETGEDNCLANPDANEKRWTFYHKSSRAAAPIQTNSEGSRLLWGFGILVLPFAGFTAITLRVGRWMIDEARASPGISYLVWVLVLIGLLVVSLVFWRTIQTTLIRAPWVFGVLGGIFLGVLATEWFGDSSYLAAFVRLRPKEGVDATALGRSSSDPLDVDASVEDAATDGGSSETHVADIDAIPGRLTADIIPQRMARAKDGSGTRSAIKRAFWPFIARFRGARADMEVQGRPRTHIDVEHGPYEELYFLDPEADVPLEYRPESHAFELPDLIYRDDDGNLNVNAKAIVGGLGALAASGLAGMLLLGSAPIGLLVSGSLLAVWKLYLPNEGWFKVRLAPVHYGNVLMTVLNHADKLGDLKSWETVFEEWHREKAENKAENKAIADRASASQMDQVADRFVGSDDGSTDDE
jgi:hypothetical protein